MKDKNIADMLKQYRKTSGLSVKEVIEMLEKLDIYISYKTLYGYESGISMPNADVFIALCHIYNSYDLTDSPEERGITSKELRMIERYRMLDSDGKRMVDYTLKFELKRSKDLEEAQEELKKRMKKYSELLEKR